MYADTVFLNVQQFGRGNWENVLFLITKNNTLPKLFKKHLPSIGYSMNFDHNKHIVQQCFYTPMHTYFTKE